MLKRATRNPALRRAIAAVVAAYLRFSLGTTQWRVIGEENIVAPEAGDAAIFACWHERLALMPMFGRRLARRRGIHVLISQSHDGRLIADVVGAFGIGVAHGSSSRGGAAGLRAMLGVLGAGGLVGLTPDGPRGPRRSAQPGVAQLAALSGATIIPCAAWTNSGFTLASWDRMRLPLPFGRGVVVCGPPVMVPRDGWRDAIPGIEAALSLCASCAEAELARPIARRRGLTTSDQ